MNQRRRGLATRGPAWAIGLIGVAALASACGGGGSGPTVAHLGSTTSTSTPAVAAASNEARSTQTLYAGLVKYAGCMRTHGVSAFPDPSIGPKGGVQMRITPASGINPKSASFQSAQTACKSLQPSPPTPPPIPSQDQGDYLKAANCMRAHGVNGFPDPVFTGSQVNWPIPKSMNIYGTTFVKARLVCEKLIPAGLPYSAQDPTGQ